MPTPVVLHIYDVGGDALVSAINQQLRALGTGAFHAAVEVQGVEWSFGYCEHDGTGVFSSKPKQCEMHKYRESLMMPVSMVEPDVKAILGQLQAEWPGKDYDLLHRNCCHFSDAFCQALGVGPIPSWVTNLAGAGATLTDASQKAAGAVTAAAVVAAAKAGDIDEKYAVSGTVKSKAADVLEQGRLLDERYKVSDTLASSAVAVGAAAQHQLTLGIAAKELVDKSGSAGAQVLGAMDAARQAVDIDGKLVEQIAAARGIYADASEMLLGTDSSAFAQAFGERKDRFKEVEQLLLQMQPLPSPNISDLEAEAIQIMKVKTGAGETLGQAAQAMAPLQVVADIYGTAAKDRFQTANAGKELLDSGGEEAVMMLVAKKLSKEVAASDRDLVKQQLASVKMLYTDAANEIMDTQAATDSNGLAMSYMKRLKLYTDIEKMLGEPVEMPPLKGAEGDAIALLMAKDQYSWASGALVSGFLLKGVTKQGTLSKRGPTAAFGWDARWCVLEARRLVFYTEASMRNRKGDIDILVGTKVSAFSNILAPGESIKYKTEKPNGFVLDPNPEAGKSRKLYYWDVPSAEEQKSWIEAIEAAAKLLGNIE